MHSTIQLVTEGVCVLYMNIRSPIDNMGYPGRDSIPAQMLTDHCPTEDEYRIRCFAFFAAIFKVLRTSLEQNQPNWYKDMCDLQSHARRSFFADLVKEYASASTMDVRYFVAIFTYLQVEKTISTTPSIGSRVMNEYYKKMVTSENFPQANANEPTVVIAIDEAHVLHEKHDSEPFSRAAVLLRTIKEYSQGDENQVWVVFGSTTSKVAHFASPQALCT